MLLLRWRNVCAYQFAWNVLWIFFEQTWVLHPVVIIRQIQFPSLSTTEAFMICLLRDVKVPVSSPVSFVSIVRVNSVSPRTYRWFGKNKLLMRGFIQEWLVRKCILVVHYLAWNVNTWLQVWRKFPFWWTWFIWAVIWAFLGFHKRWGLPWYHCRSTPSLVAPRWRLRLRRIPFLLKDFNWRWGLLLHRHLTIFLLGLNFLVWCFFDSNLLVWLLRICFCSLLLRGCILGLNIFEFDLFLRILLWLY